MSTIPGIGDAAGAAYAPPATRSAARETSATRMRRASTPPSEPRRALEPRENPLGGWGPGQPKPPRPSCEEVLVVRGQLRLRAGRLGAWQVCGGLPEVNEPGGVSANSTR